MSIAYDCSLFSGSRPMSLTEAELNAQLALADCIMFLATTLQLYHVFIQRAVSSITAARK